MTEQEDANRKFEEFEFEKANQAKAEDILTEQEIQKFGMETLFEQVQKEGYEVLSLNTDLNQHPQMVLKKDEQIYFVMVKTVPSNQNKDIYDTSLAEEVISHSKSYNAIVLFAGISLHCLTTGHTLLRGAPYIVNYTGMITLR